MGLGEYRVLAVREMSTSNRDLYRLYAPDNILATFWLHSLTGVVHSPGRFGRVQPLQGICVHSNS